MMISEKTNLLISSTEKELEPMTRDQYQKRKMVASSFTERGLFSHSLETKDKVAME